MKNNLTVNASLFTLILAFVVSVSFAVTEVMKKENHVKASKAVITQIWYYQLNSNADEDIDNPANYATTKPDPKGV